MFSYVLIECSENVVHAEVPYDIPQAERKDNRDERCNQEVPAPLIDFCLCIDRYLPVLCRRHHRESLIKQARTIFNLKFKKTEPARKE